MADKSEWKTPSMEGELKGDGHQYGRKHRTPKPIPIAGKLTYSEEANGHWTPTGIEPIWIMIMMMMTFILALSLWHIVSGLRFWLSEYSTNGITFIYMLILVI